MSTVERRRVSIVSAIATAVAAGERHDRRSKPTVSGIKAEAQQLIRNRMQEAGIHPIRIPNQAKKLQSAICALFRHLGEGRPLSAKRAAWEAGVLGRSGAKLAYRVPIKGEAVHAAICLMPSVPFVRRLRKDAGWSRQVVGTHRSLSALAQTLRNAYLSIGGPVERNSSAKSRSRGDWHSDARTLRSQGWSGNRIARHLGVNLKSVESFLSRDKRRQVGSVLAEGTEQLKTASTP